MFFFFGIFKDSIFFQILRRHKNTLMKQEQFLNGFSGILGNAVSYYGDTRNNIKLHVLTLQKNLHWVNQIYQIPFKPALYSDFRACTTHMWMSRLVILLFPFLPFRHATLCGQTASILPCALSCISLLHSFCIPHGVLNIHLGFEDDIKISSHNPSFEFFPWACPLFSSMRKKIGENTWWLKLTGLIHWIHLYAYQRILSFVLFFCIYVFACSVVLFWLATFD